METWTIGELARKAGIRASAIRFYESVGLLAKPPRASGWRRYDSDALGRLGVIQGARDLGFSLGEIKTILTGSRTERRLRPVGKLWRARSSRKWKRTRSESLR